MKHETKHSTTTITTNIQSDGRGLTKVKIGEFFDSGRNVFIATDVDASKSMRAVFNEFGVEVDEYVINNHKQADYFTFFRNNPFFKFPSNILANIQVFQEILEYGNDKKEGM